MLSVLKRCKYRKKKRDFKTPYTQMLIPKKIKISEPEGSRTPNLLIRSEMLYPIKLQVQEFGVQR